MMNRRLAQLSLFVAVMMAAGCAQMSNVTTGEVVLKNRLAVQVDRPWNQFERGLADNTMTWTQDGVTVDALRFYIGLKDGELLAPTPPEPKGQRALAFRATMQPAEVVELFEGLYSRGGSSFKLEKLSPDTFVGSNGFRFEFSAVRKSDEVRLRGVGWGAVRNGELFAVTFTAPRLAFFPQHASSAESIARSARLRP
jgi:hypothetical protein